MITNIDNQPQQILKQYYSRYGGFWRFPEMLDYCYLVNPYFNRSMIIKEMQDFFPTLVSEYPSGMGAACHNRQQRLDWRFCHYTSWCNHR